MSWPNGNAGGSSSASCTTARPCGRPRWCCGWACSASWCPTGHAPLLEAIDDVQDELHLVLQELRDVAGAALPAAARRGGARARAARAGGAARRAGAVVAAPTRRRGSGAAEGAVYFAVAGCLAAAARRRPVEIVIRSRTCASASLVVSVTGRRPRASAGRCSTGSAPLGRHAGRRCGRDRREVDPVRVALAEDGALFREGLLMLLEAAGHEVVGLRGGRRRAGRELLDHPAADVAILDIRMPPEPDGGLVTAERLRAAHPDMGLLFLSHYAESHYLMRILEIGTDAHRLPAQGEGGQRRGALRHADPHRATARSSSSRCWPSGWSSARAATTQGPRRGAVGARARRAALMAEGRSNGGIAAQLFVSAKAVEKHIANIFGKLGLHADASEHHRRVLAVLTYLRSQRDERLIPWRRGWTGSRTDGAAPRCASVAGVLAVVLVALHARRGAASGRTSSAIRRAGCRSVAAGGLRVRRCGPSCGPSDRFVERLTRARAHHARTPCSPQTAARVRARARSTRRAARARAGARAKAPGASGPSSGWSSATGWSPRPRSRRDRRARSRSPTSRVLLARPDVDHVVPVLDGDASCGRR